MYYFTFQDKTAFIPFREVYPECLFLIEDEPRLSPLVCMRDSCHRNKNCAEKIAKRVHYLFEKVITDSELIIAYFKWRDRPDSIRAGVFYRDMREPRVITCNRSAFNKFRKEGITYFWEPTQEYNLIGSDTQVIPAGDLLRVKL